MADNVYAGSSVQVYPGGESTLSTPHSDVGAFLAYVSKFNSVNFHAKDDDVREWRFNHEYDNWQDSLGMDSVKVFYHYGHCGMTPGGTLVVGMGRTWDNTFYADSTRMSFGDQRLRYLFLHGCDNLQMHFGQDPYRSFHEANKGARMIFGFDSTTYDVDGLGAGFFREWNTGKSFSQSWQDAAFATLRDHRPSSTACGATAEEAQDRLWNERLFHSDAASDNWYWWRWAGPAPLEVVAVITVPTAPKMATLRPRRADQDRLDRLASQFDVRPVMATARSPHDYEDGHEVLQGPRAVLSPDGSYDLFFDEPDRTAEPRDPEEIRRIADSAVERLSLDNELALDSLTMAVHGGTSREDEQVEARVGEYTAHYRQLTDGVPVVRGREGHVTVTLDPSGRICAMRDATVDVTDVVEASPREADDFDIDRRLDEAVEAARESCCGVDAEVRVIDDQRDIGWSVAGDAATLVARQAIEVRTGDFAIRRLVEIAL
jgi:Family of unknown function (DUF6345)